MPRPAEESLQRINNELTRINKNLEKNIELLSKAFENYLELITKLTETHTKEKTDG